MSPSVSNIILIVLIFTACNSEEKRLQPISSDNSKVTYHKVELTVENIVICQYPKQNPVYTNKANKKIVVVEVRVRPLKGSVKDDIIPQGAILADTKANQYETWSGAVAIAQSAKCIRGDDLKAYNQIWNGDVKEGETAQAFALGFEIPADAVIEKLYWNKKWIADEHFIDLHKNN